MSKYEAVVKLIPKTKHAKFVEALTSAGREYVSGIPVSRKGNYKFSKADRGYLRCLDDIINEISFREEADE